jgi:hypothetical protein
MDVEDQARGLRWIARSKAVLTEETGVMPTKGAGWTQPRLFDCAEDGAQVAGDRAERFRRARRVLEDTERRTGVKRPPEPTQDESDGAGEG